MVADLIPAGTDQDVPEVKRTQVSVIVLLAFAYFNPVEVEESATRVSPLLPTATLAWVVE
jgi:hypothetical protein